MGFYRKLKQRNVWRKIFYERLTEPIHLNLLSVLVALFGSYRMKVAYDLIVRQYHAYGILRAADLAKAAGLDSVCVLEFGVAAGAGMMNLCLIAQKVSALTGVDVKIFGFDTGKGMPAPRDYRDHPDFYQEGDFPADLQALKRLLPANGQLVLGELAVTVPQFLQQHASAKCPIGYVVLDVDYYSSTVEALKLFEGNPQFYLPTTAIYVDDIQFVGHNPFAGELLAINEFNAQHQFRKICFYEFLECSRIFRRAEWIKHMFTLQVMDHPARMAPPKRSQSLLANPYL
jgi:hypothetical protein